MKNYIKMILVLFVVFSLLMAFSVRAKPSSIDSQNVDTSSNYTSPVWYSHGVFLGAQLGYVALHNSHTNSQTPSGIIADTILFNLNHFGGRLYAGIRPNDYFAVEAGYTHLANMDENGGLLQVKDHTKMHSIDVFIKGILPLSNHFSVFAKGGAAYVKQDILDSINNGSTILYKSNTSRILPAFGLGLNLNVTKSFAFDLAWTHMFKSGEIKNIDFTSLGISYTFAI